MTDKPWIAPGVLRSASHEMYTPSCWRRGPDTPDGFWMVYASEGTWKLAGVPIVPAVRVIVAPDGKDYRLSGESPYNDLGYAIMKPRLDAEDAYLMAVEVVADMGADPLTILRHAVLIGRTGGAEDGATTKPAKRRPKVAAR